MAIPKMNGDTHRLAQEALRLKKASLLAVAVIGADGWLKHHDLVIPDYSTFDRDSLNRHVSGLKAAFQIVAKQLLLDWEPEQVSTVTAWFAQQFDAWQQSGLGLFDLGRVHELEKAIGRLGHRRHMDCPLYAQVLLQGYNGAAIRHPEYHLARDIALLYNLFMDEAEIRDRATREGRPRSSEHGQSLARSVILACFNLLESFVSGLTAEWLLKNPGAPVKIVEKLEDTRSSLRTRFVEVPAIITGKAGLLDAKTPPLEPLFGECKQRRDSLVHCEP